MSADESVGFELGLVRRRFALAAVRRGLTLLTLEGVPRLRGGGGGGGANVVVVVLGPLVFVAAGSDGSDLMDVSCCCCWLLLEGVEERVD